MTRQERRRKKLDAHKNRMPKHGKSLGEIYRNAVTKRAGRIKNARSSES